MGWQVWPGHEVEEIITHEIFSGACPRLPWILYELSVWSSITHRYRRLAAILDPHPTVLRVARRRVLLILLAQLGELVGLDRLAFCFDVDAEQLGRVEAEDLVFDVVGQFGVAIFLLHFLRHFQLAQAHDLALRTAAPDRIGAPEDVVHPGYLDHLAEHVQARL